MTNKTLAVFESLRGTLAADPEPTPSAGRLSDGRRSVPPRGGGHCGGGGISQVQ